LVAAAASDRIMNLGRSASKANSNTDIEKEGRLPELSAHDHKHHAAANGSTTTTVPPLSNASLSSDNQGQCQQQHHPPTSGNSIADLIITVITHYEYCCHCRCHIIATC